MCFAIIILKICRYGRKKKKKIYFRNYMTIEV